MKLLITGAKGFVGGSMTAFFAGQGHEVLASGRAPAPAGVLRYLQADITCPFPPVEVDAVVHVAALASDSAGYDALYRANVLGTQHVWEATRDSGVFVFISSSSVYDYTKVLHTESESVDIQQLGAYGRTKRLAEEWLLRQDWSRRRLVILRPRAVYGIGDRVLLPRLMRLVKGNKIISPGDMRVQCSMTHIDNLCTAAALAIQQEAWGAQVYNVADARPYEMRRAVQTLLSAVYGQELDFSALPIGMLRGAAGILERLGMARQFTRFSLAAVSKDCILDIGKISAELGYQPTAALEPSVAEIAAWARAM